MRSLQRRAGPDQHAIDIPPIERNGRQLHGLLGSIAPDRDADPRRLGGTLQFSEPIHDLAVDREQQIAGLEQMRRRRARHESINAEHLAARLIVLLEAPHPGIRQAELARSREGLPAELGFDGVDRTVRDGPRERRD